jgi:hypothetical protein
VNGSSNHRPLTTKDLFLKDAFLVFRAMCKLTMKPLNTERSAFVFLVSYLSLHNLLAVSVNATSSRMACARSCSHCIWC